MFESESEQKGDYYILRDLVEARNCDVSCPIKTILLSAVNYYMYGPIGHSMQHARVF